MSPGRGALIPIAVRRPPGRRFALPPGGFPGRRLLLPAVFAAAFAVLAWIVLAHGAPYGVDTGPHRWSVSHRPHAMVTAARNVTDAGTGPWPPLAAALGGWLAAVGRTARRRLVMALLALVVLTVGQSLRTALVVGLHRARPPAADWAAAASGHSFPSGHTASGAMAAGLLCWGLLRALPGAAGRITAAVSLLVAAAIGCTRVYLGVHWPTDVLGGWLFAACWLSGLLPLLTAYLGGEPPPPGEPSG